MADNAERRAMAHEIGVVLDDALERYRKDRDEQEGVKKGILLYRQKIQEFMKVYVDKDVDSGTLDLTQGDLVRRYLARAVGAGDSLTALADFEICRAQGRIQAMEVAIKLTKKAHDSASEPPLPDPNRKDGHPGMTLKQQRLLEEQMTEKLAVCSHCGAEKSGPEALCSRCVGYRDRYKKLPPEHILEKWKARAEA